MKNITNNAIVIGVIGLIVGLVLGWMIGRGNSSAPVAMNDKENESENIVISDVTNSDGIIKNTANVLFSNSTMSEESDSVIMVVDQGAGSITTVGSVETDTSVWVAVREEMNGMPGSVLGAARVDAGENRNIVVRLLRPTEAGKMYQINLFKDNGDRKFDYKVDALMTSGGELISQSFKVSAQ